MERFAIACLGIALVFTSVVNVVQDYKIKNLEQTIKHVEQGYNEVLAENQQLERINNQNVRLMAEGSWPERGGWDVMASANTDD